MEKLVIYWLNLSINHSRLKFNLDLKHAYEKCNVQIGELEEWREQCFDNSLLYKLRLKRYHDSRINQREFRVGMKVLLFNSRLRLFPGKLKSRWTGPYTITKIFPFGGIEIKNHTGLRFKVNGQRLKEYKHNVSSVYEMLTLSAL